ncbi:MAG: HAD-superfamily hydrolase [candidate division WS6 bacterium 36_33]|uniref:HAD-superfamily hydrolase n=1 Tax=candidate division WS6 bacterium 36_33 TaxID=1641388 RepID=A0A101GZA6_9BACT|nr:MAG: HAD-superfamily hydrolase [candidate division WS6 bacterium 36_33]
MDKNLPKAKQLIQERKAFLFDFDGTLVNLDKLNVDSFKILFKNEFDLEFTRDDFMSYVSGRGSKDGIKKYLGAKGIKEFNMEELNNQFSMKKKDLIEKHLEEEVFLIPGIDTFLKYLSVHDKRMLVVTSSHYTYVKKILRNFGLFGYFEKVYDRESVEKGKPNAEIFLQGIKYTGLENDECIAFEDSLFGLKSAKGANLYTVGILNKGWNEDFVYDLADVVIEDYEQLI